MNNELDKRFEADNGRRYSLAFIGNGKIGKSLFDASQNALLGDRARIVGKSDGEYDAIIADSRILILCMHQEQIISWLEEKSANLKEDHVILSIGAYLHFNVLERFSNGKKLGRIMTGTGVASGTERIVWSSDGNFSQDEILDVQYALTDLGETVYLTERNDKAIDRETLKVCQKGVLSYILGQKIESDMREFGFTREEASHSVTLSLKAILSAVESGKTYDQVSDEVTSKFGVTEGWKLGLRTIGHAYQRGAHSAKTRIGNIQSRFKQKNRV